MIHLHERPVALTFTGGIDSTVLAYYLAANDRKLEQFCVPTPFPAGHQSSIWLVACDYGQANFVITRRLLQYHLAALRERFPSHLFKEQILSVTLPVWEMQNGLFQVGYRPPRQDETVNDQNTMTYDYSLTQARNAIILLWLATWATRHNILAIYTGHQCEVNEWDVMHTLKHRTEDFSPMFIDRLNLMLEVGFSKLARFIDPFNALRLSKYNIVELGKQLNVDLGATYSCQFIPPCGKCDGCVIRRKAFGLLNVDEQEDSTFASLPTPA